MWKWPDTNRYLQSPVRRVNTICFKPGGGKKNCFGLFLLANLSEMYQMTSTLGLRVGPQLLCGFSSPETQLACPGCRSGVPARARQYVRCCQSNLPPAFPPTSSSSAGTTLTGPLGRMQPSMYRWCWPSTIPVSVTVSSRASRSRPLKAPNPS